MVRFYSNIQISQQVLINHLELTLRNILVIKSQSQESIECLWMGHSGPLMNKLMLSQVKALILSNQTGELQLPSNIVI